MPSLTLLLPVLGLLLCLGGCAGGEDFTYVPGNEIKPGPGLFSGKDGGFTLGGPGETTTEKKTEVPRTTGDKTVPPAP